MPPLPSQTPPYNALRTCEMRRETQCNYMDRGWVQFIMRQITPPSLFPIRRATTHSGAMKDLGGETFLVLVSQRHSRPLRDSFRCYLFIEN